MTEAQNLYAKPLAIKGMYTPMMVVSGAMHSSNMGAVDKRISDDSKAEAIVTIEASGKQSAAGAIVEAKIAVQQDEKIAVELTIAAAENNITTAIKAGELKGETVTEFAVVRFLSRPVAPGKDGKAAFEVPRGKDWKAENVYLAIVARDPETKKVLGAKRLEWKDLTEAKK
ncbi:MAG: hypothetical protein FD180_1325 [Planctomycetota bacterium]|nr:MAG: hypothetical protein FD180_1325 [Planctomycetota bacterium]